ncbi:MAG: hypothetical protein RL701_2317 [Pseudomonadota bacterium]
MASTSERIPTVAGEFSFTRGGPLFRLERLLGLVPQRDRFPPRLLVSALSLTWLPLLLLALPERLYSGEWDPLITRSEVHVRLLGSLAIMLFGELVLDERGRAMTQQLARTDVIPKEARFVWQHTLARLAHMRDAWQPEALLFGFVYVMSVLSYVGWLPPWALRWLMPAVHEAGVHWARATPVLWWYLVVSQPLFIFVFLRWITRWLLLARLLWCLARLHPRVHASHADRAGGLAYLALPLFALRFFVAASALALSSVWLDEIARSQAKSSIFAADLLWFLVASLAMFVLPYLPFSRLLLRARLQTLLAYSELMDEYVASFDKRWLHARGHTPSGRELLGHPDFSGLADLGASFRVAEEMRSSIPSFADLKVHGLASLVPFLVLLPAHATSAADFVERLVMKLLGGA